MPPRRQTVIATATIAAGVGAFGLIVAALVVPLTRMAVVPEPPKPAATYAAPAAAPVAAANPKGDGTADLVDHDWLVDTAETTGIPLRALAAYAGAALAKAESAPECGISWNTLAAIGYVESRHGTYGGSTMADDGKISPPIYGVALDGGNTAHIPDSDEGRYDKDTEYDRAVGPMQMIPATWRNWSIDANADGKDDPQNMDDAVLAATNYLCRASDDMVGRKGWRTGIAAYNSAPSYLVKVAEQAVAYAREG